MTTTTAPRDQRNEQARVAEDGDASASGDPSQIVSFRLAREEYGLDIMGVQEIILMGSITEIPEVPDYIRGLINLRGKVIPIVDLRKRFSLDAAEPTEHTRIIVVNAAGTTLGIIVDAVSEVLRIDRNQIEPAPSGLVGVEQAYIKGLVKMDEKIMILLCVENVLSRDDRTRLSSTVSGRDSTTEAS